MTRRNCPLLNCESVLLGIETDGQPLRGSHAPQRSETKISSTRLSSMTRNGLIAIRFVCLLIAGTGRADGLGPSKRLTQYPHNVRQVQNDFFPRGLSWVSQIAAGYRWVATWQRNAVWDSGASATALSRHGLYFEEYDTKNHVDPWATFRCEFTRCKRCK